MNSLLPCPKCGCPDQLSLDSNSNAEASWIECGWCEHRMQRRSDEETLADEIGMALEECAIAQQPAAVTQPVGGDVSNGCGAPIPPSAPVGVEAIRRMAEVMPPKPMPGDDYGYQMSPNHLRALHERFAALTQQPASVDEAMVERALAAYLRRQDDGESLYGCVTAALTAALHHTAAQEGKSDE